jgi:hypothetical protein
MSMSDPTPQSTSDVSGQVAAEAGPELPPAAPPRRRWQRVADAFVYIAVPLMVLALFDPLEGGVLIAVLAIPVAVVAFMRHSRARWILAAGLLLFAAAFAYMTVAGQVAEVLQAASLVPWMAAVLVTVAGGLWLVHDTLAARQQPRAARAIPAALAVAAVLLTARVTVLLGQYRPWDVPMSERASATGAGVRLVLLLESPKGTEMPFGGAAVLENTGAQSVTLPPGTLLDVLVRDAGGTVVWDGAKRYYGPVPPAMPWDQPVVVAPGSSTTRRWMLACPTAGEVQVTAQVTGGPFDGLTTEPVTVTCPAVP